MPGEPVIDTQQKRLFLRVRDSRLSVVLGETAAILQAEIASFPAVRPADTPLNAVSDGGGIGQLVVFVESDIGQPSVIERGRLDKRAELGCRSNHRGWRLASGEDCRAGILSVCGGGGSQDN